MADEIKKNQIKYKDTVYTLEDARIPDPSGKSGKILGVNSNGQYELRDESSGGGSEGGGSSGGAVASVNGKTGVVNLTAEDVGALPSSYQAPVTSVNGQTGDVVISGGGSGTTISVDNTLSNESTNPVQNKVIKAALDNKVDKVTGKSLSTNDFTNTYKNALDNLDTTLSNKQDKLTAGSGIIISNNEISATGSGGSVDGLEWVPISSGTGGLSGPLLFETGENVDVISYLSAQYCPALKIVKFGLLATINERINATPENPQSIIIKFSDSSKYKPSFFIVMDYNATCQGVASGRVDTHPVACAIEVWDYNENNNFTYNLHSEIGTTVISGSSVYITGFYYTTDIPESGS